MERAAYAAAGGALEHLLALYLRLRRYRGFEHPTRWRERLGYASLVRPEGTLLWFHAVSLGEGLAAVPVIQKCIQMRPSLRILMTTGTLTAFHVLERVLPPSVLFQFVPIDTPAAVDRFLTHWHPEAGIFMESELWPNLLLLRKIPMALINARMSDKSFRRWSCSSASRALVAEMLGSFSLICALSTEDAVRLQLLGACPTSLHFVGNSKYVVKGSVQKPLDISFAGREAWLAASTHPGEEEAIARVHIKLKEVFPKFLTIIAPRHSRRAPSILRMLRKCGLKTAQRSTHDQLLPDTDVYLADTTGELEALYQAVPIAFVGGSLLSGMAGHNFAEAAACSCAVITGPHIGHFSKMLREMKSISPLSVQQVSCEKELLNLLREAFEDGTKLQALRVSAKHACLVGAGNVVEKTWSLVKRAFAL